MAKALATIAKHTLAVQLEDTAVDAILFSAQQFATRQGGILQLQNMPTESERGLLLSRLTTLRQSMAHDRKAVAKAIADMLVGFPAAVKPNETAEQVISWYVQEMELEPAVPTWAVERACLDIRLCKATDIGPRTYPRPSTMAVRKLADAYAYKARCEINSITDVLKGRQADPVLPPAERERVAKFWETLAHNLKQRNTGSGAAVQSAEQLRDMVGAEVFEALPDAPRAVTMPSVGRVARRAIG